MTLSTMINGLPVIGETPKAQIKYLERLISSQLSDLKNVAHDKYVTYYTKVVTKGSKGPVMYERLEFWQKRIDEIFRHIEEYQGAIDTIKRLAGDQVDGLGNRPRPIFGQTHPSVYVTLPKRRTQG